MLLVEMNEWGALCGAHVPWRAARRASCGAASGSCTFAAWSPMGMMYFSSDSGAFHIWRQRYPRPAGTDYFRADRRRRLAMAPDGRSFITRWVEAEFIWLHEAEATADFARSFAFAPRFTPDGKRLLYQVRKGRNELWWETRFGAVSRCDGLASDWRVWRRENYDISPDGAQVIVVSPDSAVSRVVAGAGGSPLAPRQIPNVEGNSPSSAPAAKSFSATSKDSRSYTVPARRKRLRKPLAAVLAYRRIAGPELRRVRSHALEACCFPCDGVLR